MYSKGSCLGIPCFAKMLLVLSVQICLICISLIVQLVNIKQNLFISGDKQPGSQLNAQPVIIIIKEQSRTQKYLNYGRMPFLTKLLQVISIALANKKSAQACLDFLSRNIIEISPAKNPEIKGIYFCFYYGNNLLIRQKDPLKISTKDPKNNPNFNESLLKIILIIAVLSENIFLMLNNKANPDLIKQETEVIFKAANNEDQKHPFKCLQQEVFISYLKPIVRNKLMIIFSHFRNYLCFE